MTTFEITIIVLLAVIVVLLIVLLRTAIEGFHDVWKNQNTILGDTMVLKAYFNNLLERFDNISRQLDNIESNIIDDLRDIHLADKLGKTSPNVPTALPCYAPNGICTEAGNHYTCIAHPYYGNINKPAKGKWFVDVVLPKGFPHFIWHHDTGGIVTWDFSDEFVVCEWASSGTTCPTVKSIARRIQKWKLPVGSKVILNGRYVGEEYVFLIRK